MWTGPSRLVCHNFPLVSFPDRGTKKTWWILGEHSISDSNFKVNGDGKKKNPAAVSRVAEMTSLQMANAFFTRWTGSRPSDVKWISLSRIVNLSATGCATSSCHYYSSREVTTSFPSLALLHCLENNLPTPPQSPPPRLPRRKPKTSSSIESFRVPKPTCCQYLFTLASLPLSLSLWAPPAFIFSLQSRRPRKPAAVLLAGAASAEGIAVFPASKQGPQGLCSAFLALKTFPTAERSHGCELEAQKEMGIFLPTSSWKPMGGNLSKAETTIQFFDF